MKALAPSMSSSRRQSTVVDFDVRSRVGESTTMSERTAVEKGERWVSPQLVDEPESESESEKGGRASGVESASQEKEMKGDEEKGKSKKSRRRFWPFKRKKAEPELKVHGTVKDLLDRAVWTMQTGHRAVAMACCDQCCDCEG